MEPIEISNQIIADLKKELDDMLSDLQSGMKIDVAKIADKMKQQIPDRVMKAFNYPV